MKTVLFLSDQNRYLEHHLYLKIVQSLGEDVKSIYLESDISNEIYYKVSKEDDFDEKKIAFDEYRIFDPVKLDKSLIKNPLLKGIRIWRNFQKKLAWRRGFLNTIDELNPDLCILITTLSPNGKMASLYRPRLKKVYIQPSTTRVEILPKRNLVTKVRDWIYEWIFRLPLIPQKELSFNNIANVDYLLWSELWIRHVEKHKASKYISVGAPHFDELFASRQYIEPKLSFQKCLVILNKEQFIGIDAWNEYAYFYQEVVAANPEIEFIFKVHPLGDFKATEKLFPNSKVTIEPYPLSKADCILTHWSTLAIDGMILKIPTLLINPGGSFDFSSKYFDDYNFILEKPKEVNKLLDKLKQGDFDQFNEAADTYLKLSLSFTDGKSTERIISHINALLA